MAIDIAWDSDFNIKSLFPKTSDKNNLPSPQAVTAGGNVTLVVPDDAVGVVFTADALTTVEVRFTNVGGAPQAGSYNDAISPGVELRLPTEKIESVNITSSNAVSLSYYFLLA